MAKFPSMTIWTDSYLSDTRHLTAAQHGAYFLLLMTCWRTTDCSLPNDDVKLAKWASMDQRTWLKQKSVVMSFWDLGDDHKWRQARLSDEREYAENTSRKNSVAGTASALKRKKRHSTSVEPNTSVTDTPIPSPKPKEEYTSDFEKWWSVYPKKDGKRDAAKAFDAALKKADLKTLTDAAVAYANKVTGSQAKHVKNAQGWLNSERWNDLPPEGSVPLTEGGVPKYHLRGP